jgi:hypothetical protein
LVGKWRLSTQRCTYRYHLGEKYKNEKKKGGKMRKKKRKKEER